jgi:hypothetical protein
MSTSKIKLEINGVKLTLPSSTLMKSNWKGEAVEPFFSLRAKHVASLIKQYVKSTHPSVVCSSKSDTFSGGDSVDVYLSTKDGNEVSDEIFKDVRSFGKLFQKGNFNGMIDLYEYNDSKPQTDRGTEISGGSKYVSINNRPQFGTVPDVCKMLRDYQSGVYLGGVRDLSESIKEILGYGISQKNVDTALELMAD